MRAIISGKIYELREVLCPSCAQVILIERSVDEVIFTCPHCKSRVLYKSTKKGYGVMVLGE